MYAFSFVIYFLVVASYFMFATIKNMINQAALLAPVITYACCFLFVFPFCIFLCHLFLRLSAKKYYQLLSTQTKLAASVAVSLGLIGTFLGLTDMVSAIAGSLGGDGDIASKMGAMINSIASALSAMSFAFLTSIVGVSVSVLLLINLNFWEFFYDKENDSINESEDPLQLDSLCSRIDKLNIINTNIANKLVSLPENTDIALNLAENSNLIAERILDINSIICDIDENIKLLSHLYKTNSRNIDSELCSIKDNCSVTNDRITLTINQLTQMNENIKSLVTISEQNYQLNQKAEKAHSELLNCLINKQDDYIQQHVIFKNKMRKVFEVLSHEG